MRVKENIIDGKDLSDKLNFTNYYFKEG